MRAGKRLAKIRQRIKNEGVKTRAGNLILNVKSNIDAKRMVAEDWKTAQNIRLTDDETEDNIANVKFKFCFNEGNIERAQMKLPLEYETNISSFMEKVDA